MPNYQAYATEKDTPSRKTRKNSRAKTFLTNKGLSAKIRKERRLARKEADDALEAEE